MVIREYFYDYVTFYYDQHDLVSNLVFCRLYIEGPFGRPMEDVLRYRGSLCVAGGIGITPFAAILNHIL